MPPLRSGAPLATCEKRPITRPLVGLEHLGVVRAAGGVRVGVERGDLARELLGQHHVVAVQPRDQLAAANGERPVQGKRLALVVLAAEHPDALGLALGERAARARACASVEPSSEMISSKSAKLCASTLSTASARKRSSL